MSGTRFLLCRGIAPLREPARLRREREREREWQIHLWLALWNKSWRLCITALGCFLNVTADRSASWSLSARLREEERRISSEREPTSAVYTQGWSITARRPIKGKLPASKLSRPIESAVLSKVRREFRLISRSTRRLKDDRGKPFSAKLKVVESVLPRKRA